MRPPEFTGGNYRSLVGDYEATAASMRPPEFTGGNPQLVGGEAVLPHEASMRPPEFTGGNTAPSHSS